MSLRLADRLQAARRRRFVGREDERALFRSALEAPQLPFVLLHVFGPGGVGKTTLLKEFHALATERGTPAVYLDARNIDPSPEAFVGALQMALGTSPADNVLDVLASGGRRYVIFVDTSELLRPLDTWLREVFLPQMPDDVLIVQADRKPLSPPWYADAGWQDLIHTVPLRNLSPVQSRDYLTRRNIPSEHHDRVLSFTHGHPLALSLVADVFAQRGDLPFEPDTAPDVVKALLEQLVQKVPGPAHRTALEVCALVRVTDEALLAHTLGTADVHELFEWLRNLSFIDSGPMGLFPHDLAREALVADLRWRNRGWYAELHKRIRGFYVAALEKATGLEQQRVLFDYVFLHRDNPVVRPFLEWQESGAQAPDGLREGDLPKLVGMVQRHEGEESAAIAEHWLSRQPRNALVFRDTEHEPSGFMMMVALEEADEHDGARDPALRAARSYLQANLPLRPGEKATHFRYWLARDTYQSVSPMQSLLFISAVRHYFTPGLAFSFFPCADAEFWAPILTYAELHLLPDAGYEVGGHSYGVYGHNWRAMPPMQWLALLAEREVATATEAAAPALTSAQPVVLSEVEFTAAVHDALRNLTRTDALQRTPLLQSRLVTEKAGPGAGNPKLIATLQALVREACDTMQHVPKELKLYRAVYHTYIHPAPTQEQAAELLDVPFSTFRRHLKEGIARLSEILWQWEMQAAGW